MVFIGEIITTKDMYCVIHDYKKVKRPMTAVVLYLTGKR